MSVSAAWIFVYCLAQSLAANGGAAARSAEMSDADYQNLSAANSSDKRMFNLFYPAPADRMRDFETDRPDTTESPYTVDAGHFQAEFSFLEYTSQQLDGERSHDLSLLPVNLKLGLLNNLDLQFVLDPYQRMRTQGPLATASDSGFSDAEIRAKRNLWGNDGGKTAFAVMPFLRFPTGSSLSSHHLEGGLVFPLAVQDLPRGFDLGTMAEFDLDRNQQDSGYGLDFTHSLTVGHELFSPKLNAYVEYVGVAAIRTGSSYLAYFDIGVTRAVARNVRIDGGINVGLSHQAEDVTVFAGLSFRR